MIDEWFTEERRKQIEEDGRTIIAAELTQDEDGTPSVTGCVMGVEAILCLLTAHIMEKIADSTGTTYPEVEAKVKIAHTWSASQKAITNIINKHEGGKEE